MHISNGLIDSFFLFFYIDLGLEGVIYDCVQPHHKSAHRDFRYVHA